MRAYANSCSGHASRPRRTWAPEWDARQWHRGLASRLLSGPTQRRARVQGDGGAYFHIDHYANYMTDDVERAKAERVPVVRAMLDRRWADGSLLAPSAAEALHAEIAHAWPHTQWNVLIEMAPGGHFFYAEEQFNYNLHHGGGGERERLGVALFDRRCDTLEKEEREDDEIY